MEQAELERFASFAEKLADSSGPLILNHFRTRMDVVNKADGKAYDPVTEADRGAEELLRTLIKRAYPGHGFLGEEFGHEAGTEACTWVIDPVDGTRAFVCGMPQWGTLIALNDGVKPVIGILDQPFMKERWIGLGAKTTYRSGHGARVLKTRPCATLAEAVLTTTSPKGYFDEAEQNAFWTLSAEARMTRFGGDCYAYGLLAMGYLDAVVEARLKPWDIQALIPIIEGAGGVVTTWDGGPAYEGGSVVAAGDPRVHEEILVSLQKSMRA